MKNKVVVIGTGYVGLPLALMLADCNYQVIGVDVDREVVNKINEGVNHLKETEVNKLYNKPSVKKNFVAKTVPEEADIFVVCVPTPIDNLKKISDLTYVKEAVSSIIPFLKKGNLIIIESTIPPKTCLDLVVPLIEHETVYDVGNDILLAHCPERILPGNIFKEIVQNDRIIGGVNKKSSMVAKKMYASFVKGNLYMTDVVTAELCKLIENTYRDVNIALANEISNVCDSLEIDVKEAINLSNKHPRVFILDPGIGVGGHCIPIDPWFIKETDPLNSDLIQTARRINDAQPDKIASKIRKFVAKNNKAKILLLGAAYKPDSYDYRESPALKIYNKLKIDGYNVVLHDPIIEKYNIGSTFDVIKGCKYVVVLVKHKVFTKELKKIKANSKVKVLEF